ncbi:FAD-dependent oxidoreductase [Microvirga sp. BT689]|uniref:FAD-dependent oxidoreductase n=1 Tax=Microvirga arvi TaxID=2778731 RepID=UPI001951AB0B|nr:FAD-dependent oxidoreductase [Microvirga arvi]MBM6581696.1 FAD-dependent oxidoreductase [Microvirga arvi]
MEKILGSELGDFIRKLHEQHGVLFHLRDRAALTKGTQVTLECSTKLRAAFVVAGAGVRPRTRLAQMAGIRADCGILVSECLEISVPGIFTTGEIERWPDAHTGAGLRIEHWVVDYGQCQAAARSMSGFDVRFSAPPFFWSRHYVASIQ